VKLINIINFVYVWVANTVHIDRGAYIDRTTEICYPVLSDGKPIAIAVQHLQQATAPTAGARGHAYLPGVFVYMFIDAAA